MAEFYVYTKPRSRGDNTRLFVSIAFTGGQMPGGHPTITEECATVQEVDDAVDRVIRQLNEAREQAKAKLEENEGL